MTAVEGRPHHMECPVGVHYDQGVHERMNHHLEGEGFAVDQSGPLGVPGLGVVGVVPSIAVEGLGNERGCCLTVWVLGGWNGRCPA